MDSRDSQYDGSGRGLKRRQRARHAGLRLVAAAVKSLAQPGLATRQNSRKATGLQVAAPCGVQAICVHQMQGRAGNLAGIRGLPPASPPMPQPR